ncbi:hypothetical protein GCM10008983_13410 [Lentibacillus halophilus]|uniref:Uncharacterized protein n=1 Tax=Lentibacillus halophilus TaxID=295065 RepID=A0ABP3J1X4_9BACI
MPILFVISVMVVVSVFLITPLSDLTQNNRWIIYVLSYYVLFLIHITVLAMIHKAKKNTISNENKVAYSFVWTSLGLLVVMFIV